MGSPGFVDRILKLAIESSIHWINFFSSLTSTGGTRRALERALSFFTSTKKLKESSLTSTHFYIHIAKD